MLREGWISGRNARVFTLQWHLTNECAFNCRHCYDRGRYGELDMDGAMEVVRQLTVFCRRKSVRPAISFTGGDPLCHPNFFDIYQYAAQRDVEVSILGNPITKEQLHQLVRIRMPSYYQVSLEGLMDYNDWMRGRGHYDMALSFLRETRAYGLHTHVMLTLNRDNMDQVFPLAVQLRDWCGRFTFNRLAQVGNGAGLELPDNQKWETFLSGYLEQAQKNPVLGFKDNLFNILQYRSGRKLFKGCTGHGCGAAFNFVALLPDGQVHACRKFPSLLGNMKQQALLEIYDSELAQRYRNGPLACKECPLNRSCRGCSAVTHGRGLDPFTDRDPMCFMKLSGANA